jgi:hypothetical protein
MRRLGASLFSYIAVLVTLAGCEPLADLSKDGGAEGGAAPGVCNLACIRGTHCVVSDNGPSCEPDDLPDAGTGPGVCNLACIRGTHCVVTDSGPHCQPDAEPEDAGGGVSCGPRTCSSDQICCSPSCGICGTKGGLCPAIACVVDAGQPASSCAAAQCPEQTYCDDISGTAKCIPLPSCDGMECDAGSSCELVQVQCIRAPCPPQPQCVPSTPRVCNLACKLGTHCVVSSSGPKCVADGDAGVACGGRSCAAGQICCSASCGICGSAGGACPAIACAPDL